jgi:hypothetical protein
LKDVDAAGAPIPMNAMERQDFNRELRAYKELAKVAYARIMKACRLNPKTKNLCETGNLKAAILVRLWQRFHTIDDIVKAAHLLRYSNLKQNEGESGADFVDREQKEFFALREMGTNVNDSLLLTKFIQQDTTNSKHKSLAQTVFTTNSGNFRGKYGLLDKKYLQYYRVISTLACGKYRYVQKWTLLVSFR